MTGKHVCWYFVAFFGVIVAVNAVMVTLAVRTHSGVVTDHAYEKGLAYNKVIDAEEKQKASGLRGVMDYKDGMLHFAIYDKANRPFSFDKATAAITRPTQAEMDFTVELTSMNTPMTFPASGLWEVRVDAYHEDVHFQQTNRIIVK